MFGDVLDCGRLFGGQYIYVVAELSSLRSPSYDPNDPVLFPPDFSKQADTPIDTMRNCSAVWGGASKGVIFTLLKERAGHSVDAVIDINPAKQNRYIAGTGKRVLSPDEAMASLPAGSTMFVMNSNYLDEIKSMSNNLYTYIEIENE